MSTQQILGVVGGVVGAFFGYPQLGFVVGSLVGGLLTPGEKTEGPRVDDLKVQVSTLGAGIPILYGTERVGGNVVWSTNKIEIEETTGGKGGGPENTTYRYYVHMGIVLCETPRDGSIVSIVQIFQDGKLIWDARSGISVGAALASAENPHAYFVLYQGHADQLPDPGEEGWMGGPGSVPAYRGVVRVRMNAVECPGGRVPQFSFVLSTNVSDVTNNSLVEIIPDTQDLPGTNMRGYLAGFNSSAFAFIRNTGGILQSREVRDARYVDFEHKLAETGLTNYALTGWSTESAYVMWDDTGDKNHFFIYKTDGSVTAEVVAEYLTTPTGASIFSFNGDSVAVVETSGAFNYYLSSANGGEWSGTLGAPPTNACVNESTAYIVRYSGAINDIAVISMTTGVMTTMAAPIANTQHAHIMFDGDDLYFAGVDQVLYKRIDNAWVSWMTGIPSANFDDKRGVSGGLLYTLARTSGEYTISHRTKTLNTVRVKDIIADQCERAGETRYDVSGIPDTDTLHGYKLQNPASARSNIDPLLTAFAIFIVDEDGVIKFKKYQDITSEASIAYDELGQAEDGAEAADAMPLNRAQEVDLPRSVSVSYIEPAVDYQTASEKEVRQITESNEDMIIELPMATNSDHAKQVASMILFARWRAQNTRSFKTSRKYAFLSAGDGVTVEYPRGTFRLWRITSMTDTGALCEFNVEPGDAELYTQTAVGATGYVSQEVGDLVPQTRMLLLDSPIMRDEDNNAGLYVAGEGYANSGWRGYTVWIGDDDTNLADRGTVTDAVPIGQVESVLGAWTLGMFDGKNSVTIDMGEDTLSSTTEALMLTSRVNLALIGAHGRWEAIQFQTASSLGSNRYLIYGFLRGLFGTERFAGTHEADDQFVLITPAGMMRPNMDVGSIGQTKSYRGVSLGRSLGSTTSQRLANTGVGLLPYSPWNASKSTAASNDQTITWERRTRLSSNALRGIVPLGEATESYSVEFYTSSAFTTLAGTLTSTTRSLTITSAVQTAFGLTPGATLHVHIRQVSDSVGAGTPIEANL